MWTLETSRGNEANKIKYEIVNYTGGRVLDLGSGPFKPYSHFISMDNMTEYDNNGWHPDVYGDAEDLSLFSSNSFDAIFSSHLLEHIVDYSSALKEWWRTIKVNGYLVLYLPHKEYYPNIGEKGSNPDHKHDYIPDDIVDAMVDLSGWNLLVNESRNNDNEYSFLQVYQKRNDHKHSYPYKMKRPVKTCAVVRYGGFGDLIQASSILPGLKREGYHITFYTTPSGRNILKNDPHIDSFFVQGKDQVPNNELPLFWNKQAEKYDKFINLSESVEGTFLAIPGRSQHTWPYKLRNEMLNKNYLEFAHLMADVPFKDEQRFYPSKDELKCAQKQKDELGRCVFWILSGSSVHKTWPYLDQAIARILITYPEIKIILTGDEVCQILEMGWEKEERVIKTSGKWGIRRSLTFAKFADIIIGPETGILSAVSNLSMPKIIMLSHSSVENLTKHWVNTVSLMPMECDCYPCHMMHYGFDHCRRDSETGVAKCQANISIDQFMEGFNRLTR